MGSISKKDQEKIKKHLKKTLKDNPLVSEIS